MSNKNAKMCEIPNCKFKADVALNGQWLCMTHFERALSKLHAIIVKSTESFL